MSRYVLTPLAREDLFEISRHLHPRSPAAERKVRHRLRGAMRDIARFPGLGHQRDDLADESLRFLAVYSYLIIYRPGTRPVEIVRVLHGSRDVRSLI